MSCTPARCCFRVEAFLNFCSHTIAAGCLRKSPLAGLLVRIRRIQCTFGAASMRPTSRLYCLCCLVCAVEKYAALRGAACCLLGESSLLGSAPASALFAVYSSCLLCALSSLFRSSGSAAMRAFTRARHAALCVNRHPHRRPAHLLHPSVGSTLAKIDFVRFTRRCLRKSQLADLFVLIRRSGIRKSLRRKSPLADLLIFTQYSLRPTSRLYCRKSSVLVSECAVEQYVSN